MTVHIFDIDNTLADHTVRDQLIALTCRVCRRVKHGDYCPHCNEDTGDAKQEHWDSFTNPEQYLKDVPFPHSQDYMEIVCANPNNLVFFITGRNERGRVETEEWLHMYYPQQYHEEFFKVYMRRPEQYGGGHSPASEYKHDALKWLIRKHGLVNEKFMFYEDDPHVIPMYKKYGLVLQCPDFWGCINTAGLSTGEPKVKR